jgi:allantoinase
VADSLSWALRGRVVTPDGIRRAAIVVAGEQIAAVVGPDDVPAGVPVTDTGDKLVLPGLVDTHVHVNEPGRTEWEGFATATRAAAAGGVTTLIDMPLNSSPVTTTVPALEQKRAAAAGRSWVDVGFHGGIVPGNGDHVELLLAAGVCALKAFLCHSGIDEYPNATEADLRAAMPRLAAAGVPLFAHAELVSPLPPETDAAFAANPHSYAAYLATRPLDWEVEAIRLLIDLCRETGCPVHVVHLSAATAAWPLLKKAKEQRLPVTVETCPHYLYFAAEELPDGDPRFKCAPPIRGRADRDALRHMVADGWLDTIGSDHSPAPPDIKHLADGDLRRAWGGIASLQLLLPTVWSAFADGDEDVTEQVVDALTTRPARLVGLGSRKGSIAPGYDADLVVFDPWATWRVAATALYHRHKATPYDGRDLRGRVETTYLRGRKVYDRGEFVGQPSGELLARNR